MKACPLCKNSYEDWVEFCFHDGMPLVVHAASRPAAAPKMPTLASAPTLPPSMSEGGGPSFDAFDAPEPTLIRMAKLKAAAVVTPEAPTLPPPWTRAEDSADPPDARPRAEDLPPRRADAVGVGASPPPAAAVVRRRDVAPVAATASPEAPAAEFDEFEFPHPDEDSRGTVPMYTAEPAPKRDKARDTGVGVAPAAAGIGVLMIATISIAFLVVMGGGYMFWSGQKKAAPPVVVDTRSVATPTPVVPEPVAPPPEPVAPPPEPVAPPPEPVAPPKPEPVAPPKPEPVAAPKPEPVTPAAAPKPVTPPPKPVTPPPKPVTPPPKPVTPPPKPVTPPPKPVTPPPVTTATTTSDNPWGSESAASKGKLTVTSDPAGATVTIDDRARGAAPVTIELDYGKHKVKVSAPGHKAETSEVSLNVQSMSVPFRLQAERVTGLVTVFGPTGGAAFVDGRDMGPLPVSSTLEEGVHTFKLVQADGGSCQTSRDVRFPAGGRPVQVNLSACE